MTDRDTAIRRAKALRVHASATTFVAEAETYRAKAEEIVTTYELAEEELVEEDTILSVLVDGIFGQFSDPAWRRLNADRKQLFEDVKTAIMAAVNRSASVQNPQYRMDYLEDLRKHIQHFVDDYWFDWPDPAVKGEWPDMVEIGGVRRSRDRAIAEVFDAYCLWVIRHDDLYRHEGMTDEEWRQRVRERAEELTADYHVPVRAVRAALKRVNGYHRLYTEFLPEEK